MNQEVSRFVPVTSNAQNKAADQKFCHSCGTVLHHSANNCTNCGASQGSVAPLPFQTPVAGPGNFPTGGLPPHHVFCRGCGGAVHQNAAACPKCGAPQSAVASVVSSSRNKNTAAIFAFFLGGFGAHKFYCGQAGMGIFYLLMCWTFIPAIIAFVEGIFYLSMSDAEFSRKYP